MAKKGGGGSNFLIFDGILLWFSGPDWEEEATQEFEKAAQEILSYARRNAPWTDRTGLARAGLGVEVTDNFGEVILELYHTVDYGLWLEVIQNGSYATIMPTLEHFAPEVFSQVGGVIATSQSGEDYSL